MTIRTLASAAVLLTLALPSACGRAEEPSTGGPAGEEMPVASPEAPMDTTPAGTPAPPMGAAESAAEERERRQP